MRALLKQHRLRINYQSVAGEPKVHEFDPYTLVGYKGGLYLLGRSNLADNLMCLAVERMEAVEPIRGEDGRPARFQYPKNYRPEKYAEGAFGLVDAPETTNVDILLKGDTDAYVRPRRASDAPRATAFKSAGSGLAPVHGRLPVRVAAPLRALHLHR